MKYIMVDGLGMPMPMARLSSFYLFISIWREGSIIAPICTLGRKFGFQGPLFGY
jgi:hypothetical protein